MKKFFYRLCLISIVVFLFMCAECTAYSAEPEFDGYIVSAEIDPYLVSIADENGVCVQPIVEDKNLYLAEDEEELEYLKQIGNINYIEPNYIVKLADVDFSSDYANNLYSSDLWNYKMINADVTLKNGYHGNDVRIGIIDSGLNTEHIDFAGTVTEGYNYYAKNYDISDKFGHGSFSAGIIAARLNNSGMVGIAPKAKIIPLKVFESSTTVVSFIIEAIYGGVDDFDCDVLNFSLELSANVRSLQNAINYAAEKGVICVAAAGNINKDNPENTIRYPAGYGNAIGVGSVKQNGEVYVNSVKNNSVYVVAPGVNISSVNYKGNSSYTVGTGTSYAAPHLTALVAILKSIDKEISLVEVKDILMNTSTDIEQEGYDVNSGYGIINAQAAVEYLLKERTVYQSDLYSKVDDDTLFINLNLIYRADEKANLMFVVKDNCGIIKDLKLYDASDSELRNFEYNCDVRNFEDGEYCAEIYLFGKDSLSPLYEKRQFKFSKFNN